VERKPGVTPDPFGFRPTLKKGKVRAGFPTLVLGQDIGRREP